MTEKEKYYCEDCGEEIDDEEYDVNDGLCDECAYQANEDSEYLDEEMLF